MKRYNIDSNTRFEHHKIIPPFKKGGTPGRPDRTGKRGWVKKTRYLAIIQGFIGWFMLTIFSVSLISQFLN